MTRRPKIFGIAGNKSCEAIYRDLSLFSGLFLRVASAVRYAIIDQKPPRVAEVSHQARDVR